ncbi:MAG: aminotransferase class V-fold PLP-dependent enzyme, partial [Actinomycetota bacterium]|nr:aminotransferase class V-fold PLP-dependent enzyme [Actinomycetota bacterium]
LKLRLSALASRLAAGFAEVGGVRRNGPSDPPWRLPSHVHVSVQGVDAEALLFALDQAGLCVSTGSACHSGANKASHVLAATGLDDLASVRASLGWTTTSEEVDAAAGIFGEVVCKLRAAGGGGVA